MPIAHLHRRRSQLWLGYGRMPKHSETKKVRQLLHCTCGLLVLTACNWLPPDDPTWEEVPDSQLLDDTSYVPVDLADALVHLERVLPMETLRWIRDSAASEDDMVEFHFGLGMWLRNNWGLWAGSQLSEFFNSIGIYHPDDMSGIILDSFWRKLHDRPLGLAEQVEFYQQYWAVHTEPDTLVFPECASGVELRGGMPATDDSGFSFMHLGTCKVNGTWWAYEHTTGWYRPDSAVIADFLGTAAR